MYVADSTLNPASHEDQIINTSDAPLKYLSVSTKEQPGICEYPDSGKAQATAPGLRRMHHAEDGVEYWDGEP